jgi:hypothetical protein
MTTVRDIAAQIPASVRKTLIDGNVIYKAVARPDDIQMQILVIVYEAHVFTEGEKINMDNPCMICLNNIINQMRLLEPELVILEREANLIESV